MRKPSWKADFIEFYHARRTSLRRTAYAMCGDWALADDLSSTPSRGSTAAGRGSATTIPAGTPGARWSTS